MCSDFDGSHHDMFQKMELFPNVSTVYLTKIDTVNVNSMMVSDGKLLPFSGNDLALQIAERGDINNESDEMNFSEESEIDNSSANTMIDVGQYKNASSEDDEKSSTSETKY